MFENNFYLTKFSYNNADFTSSILSIFNKNKPTSIWDCLVESSHQLEHKPKVPSDLTELINYNLKSFFTTRLGSIFPNLQITEIWYNIYTYGMFQETHTHEDNAFAGIYFLDFDSSEHTAPIFYNPIFYNNFYHPAFRNISEICYQPQVETGTLIIFPGNIPHEVLQQKSHKLRITISFNIAVDLQPYYNEYMQSIIE